MEFVEWFNDRGIMQSRLTQENMKTAFNAGKSFLEKQNEELLAEIECEERRFCGLIDQFSDVVKERDELRAQLDQYKEHEDFNPPVTCIDCCSELRILNAQLDKYEEVVKLVKLACSNDCRDFTEAYDYLSQVAERLEHEKM